MLTWGGEQSIYPKYKLPYNTRVLNDFTISNYLRKCII